MSEDTFNAEELKQEARTATEQISVAGGELIKTVQSLLREAAVRRITVQDKSGRTLVEIPLYAGVVGALLVGPWTVLALVAAWFAEVSILIERDVDSDGEPSVAAEAVERAAGSVSATAASVGASARSAAAGLGAAIGEVAQAAGEMARRAADSLEGRMGNGREDVDDNIAKAQDAAEAIIEAARSAEPQQCAATTKAGTRCKRTALAGSEFCGLHQPR